MLLLLLTTTATAAAATTTIIIIIIIIITIIIIMDICKALTLRLKALNKNNITHMMYIEMENVICNLTKTST